MKPSILKAHFTSCHSTHVHDDHKSLLAKRARFRAAGTLLKLGFCSADKARLEASYRVAYSSGSQTVRRDAPVSRFNFPKASRNILVLCHQD